jgi:hypothetical protein
MIFVGYKHDESWWQHDLQEVGGRLPLSCGKKATAQTQTGMLDV